MHVLVVRTVVSIISISISVLATVASSKRGGATMADNSNTNTNTT